MDKLSGTTSVSNNSGFSRSLWMEVQLPLFPPVATDLTTDICVVGAGIAGLTCAYTLAKLGRSVVVVDQGAIAGGQTARTTAHLSWVLDDRFAHLEKLFGEAGARQAAQSHSDAIDYIEKIISDEGIDCDFARVDGYLFVPPHNSKEILEKELISLTKMGRKVSRVIRAPFSSFDTGSSLQFPGQAQFHILKYVRGLIKSIAKYGGQIFGQTHVSHFKDGDRCLVQTESGKKIAAQALIMATCTPINNRLIIHTKQAAYRTYAIASPISRGVVAKALYWDTADPYHYIRVQDHPADAGLDWLIVGGEDHKTGQFQKVEAKYERLEKWAKKRFPAMGQIAHRWSGQIFEPIDSLAFIGRNPQDKNIYVATGHSGSGLTYGTIAGMLIPDLILGKSNPWEELYKPSRKTVRALPKFLSETVNMAAQYSDWFTPGEHKKINTLPSGEGMILRAGFKKVAVYKDQENKIHVSSAFCPHLGGCVRWNSGEKSWDCPCHGSRFDGAGKVITGPAKCDLARCSYRPK